MAARLLMAVALVVPFMYCLTAIINLYPWHDGGSRFYGIAAGINSLMAIGMGIFLLRLMRRSFTSTSLEDHARRAYGMGFDELDEMQRDRVRFQARREWKEGDGHLDERGAVMRKDAEGRAFRMLKWGLPVLVLVYWVVCLSMPIGPVRMGLLFSAVAFSGVVFLVLALPEVIRVWMMPDEVGEPKVVAVGWEA